MNLRNPYTVPIGHIVRVVLVLRKHRHLTVLPFLHDAVVDNVKLLIEQYLAIDSSYDVVLHKHKSVHLDVASKAVCVEACANFLVDLYKDIIGWLLDGTLTIFL